jgi:hypothetical protein
MLHVEVEVVDVLRLELAELSFEDHVAVQSALVEKQAEQELVFAALNGDLGADEREAVAQLAQELGEVGGQRLGQVALPYWIGGEEVENERVLDGCPAPPLGPLRGPGGRR